MECLENASGRFLEIIKEQDGQAYEKLSELWQIDVSDEESRLKARLKILREILTEYISGMEYYIAATNPEEDMRVDANDIHWNYKQIKKNNNKLVQILNDSGNIPFSAVDYTKVFVYNVLESPEENEARRIKQVKEETAERERRKRNYAKLADFHSMLQTKIEEPLEEYVRAIEEIYDKKVVPFEYTDDIFGEIMEQYYDEWKSVKDILWDAGKNGKEVGHGIYDALKDIIEGIYELLKIAVWIKLKQNIIVDVLGLIPEELEEDVEEIWEGIENILKDPGEAFEAIGQQITDVTDEKGLAYSVGYVAVDIIVEILLTKGIGKASKVGKIEDVTDVKKIPGMIDEMDDAMKVGIKGGAHASPNKIDSLLDGRPELTGSTREKLLATVQDPELSKIVNELYRPGATVGDGGTAAILVEEFSKGASTHLLKATERLKQLKKLASSGKLGLNDLDVVEALIDDLESAISLYN